MNVSVRKAPLLITISESKEIIRISIVRLQMILSRVENLGLLTENEVNVLSLNE